MKKFFLITICSFLLSSCASGPLPLFNKEKNCSPRALKQINQSPTKELTGQSNIDIFKAVQSCYHSLASEGYSGNHNICLVMSISKNGGLDFLDVADYDRPIGSDLHKCIIEKIVKVDFTDYKNEMILQPLRVE